ncbi:MAG: L,D-transpeptidase [Polyangiaceae bacterium]
MGFPHDSKLDRALGVWVVLAFAWASLSLAACKKSDPAASLATDGDAAPMVETHETLTVDAGTPGAKNDTLTAYALSSPTPITSAPEWPAKDPSKADTDRAGVVRLGYFRKGTSFSIKRDVVKKGNCPEGWFALADSPGFVCGKYATLDANAKELANAPHAPFAEGPLPYAYGLNITNGTPLYRRPPLRRERKEHERGLAIGKSPKKDKGDGHDKLSKSDDAESDGTAKAKAAPPKPVAETSPTGEPSETPWYLKNHGGQRPQITLGDLKGETSLIETRMVRGFYLALDREVHAFSGKFWRNTRGALAPADHILVHKPKTEFEGVNFADPAEPRKLPLGFFLGLYARQFTIDEEKKTETGEPRVRRGDKVPRFTIVSLTGKRKVVEGRAYMETTEGWWMRDIDGTVAKANPIPSGVKNDEKWVDVNITSQTLVSYEGEKPVYATLVSSGRHNDDPAKDHRTVTGSFRIREKHISDTMDDDGASDGPYSIEDVPWVMYFERSYALHGAFWHSSFGHERSHGCVNLTPHDARKIFSWAGPNLPAGWHGVRATDANPGTRVVVHE